MADRVKGIITMGQFDYRKQNGTEYLLCARHRLFDTYKTSGKVLLESSCYQWGNLTVVRLINLPKVSTQRCVMEQEFEHISLTYSEKLCLVCQMKLCISPFTETEAGTIKTMLRTSHSEITEQQWTSCYWALVLKPSALFCQYWVWFC